MQVEERNACHLLYLVFDDSRTIQAVGYSAKKLVVRRFQEGSMGKRNPIGVLKHLESAVVERAYPWLCPKETAWASEPLA